MRIGKSPKSTTDYDIHIFKNGISRGIILQESTSQSSQPALTTHIISKSILSGNYFARNGKSPKSTTVYNIHIFKNQISRGIVLRESTSQQSQPALTTHIFSILAFLRNYFARNGKSTKSTNNYDTHILRIEYHYELFGENQITIQVN